MTRALREYILDHIVNNLKVKKDLSSYIDPTTSIRNPSNISIGNNTFVNKECFLWAGNTAKIHIGNDVLFGPSVKVMSANHTFIGNKLIRLGKWSELDVSIGNNVWLGANVIILPGSVIPDNSIVGAGSVVNKKFRNGYTLYAGIPAKMKQSYRKLRDRKSKM
jgi:acetyltransferase-like isoleucine patch superfamily enzyme